jgi:NAD-dependent DNA ligase
MTTIIKNINKSEDVLTEISNLEIKELEEVITFAADKYYNNGESVVTDSIYDILIDFLKLKNPKSKVLKNIGAKPKGKNKVKLEYWLGSMDKIKPPSKQLEIWMKKYKPPYNLSDKLDGISALLTYNNNMIKMYTRGTAEEGKDITNIVKYLKDIPTFENVKKYCDKNNIKGDKNMIAFRGELIMNEKTFQDKWSDKLKNSRNSIGGLVNSKTINPELAKDVELVVYEVVDPFHPIDMQFKIIKDLKFKTVNNITTNNLSYEMLSKYFLERRKSSCYIIDGIIVTHSANDIRNVDGNPSYAFAFKDILEEQKAITNVIEIEWNVSKDGFLKPTILVEPVDIGGVEIKRVTGNNAKNIVDNILGIGAKVEIIRSGDVIPKIQKVIKISKSGKPDLPKGDWSWNESKVDIIINKIKDNRDVLIKNIYYFFSSLDTKGLGERNIEKIVDSGLSSIVDILEAKKSDLLKVEGFKDKTVDNILSAIKTSLNDVPLYKIMGASNKFGHGLGEERFKQILTEYPNLLTEYKKWTKIEFINKIKELNGWENKTATLFVDNLNDFIKFFNSIKKYITISKPTIKEGKLVVSDKPLIFVFTGFRDKSLHDKIENLGGKVASAISKNTNYVVVKDKSEIDDPTVKIKKAISMNIKIITKDELITML